MKKIILYLFILFLRYLNLIYVDLGTTMVKTFYKYLPDDCHRTYSCAHCQANLANHDELISKVHNYHLLEYYT